MDYTKHTMDLDHLSDMVKRKCRIAWFTLRRDGSPRIPKSSRNCSIRIEAARYLCWLVQPHQPTQGLLLQARVVRSYAPAPEIGWRFQRHKVNKHREQFYPISALNSPKVQCL